MNRRRFFAGIAAVVTAAIAPVRANPVRTDWDFGTDDFTIESRVKGPGFIAEHYGSGLHEHLTTAQWWRPNWEKSFVVGDFHYQHDIDFAELEARTLASLQTAWKECITHRSKRS